MNEPLNSRPVSYWLDLLEQFHKRIEDEREERGKVIRDLAAPLRGHPLPDWLVKRATWEGMGVLQWKALNPDWKQQFQASQQRYHSFDEAPDIDAGDMNQRPRDTDSPF